MTMVYDAEYDTWYDDGSYADGTDYGNTDEYYGYGDGYYTGPYTSTDANAADNIDVGGGWNPATGTGDSATADAAAATGTTDTSGYNTGTWDPASVNAILSKLDKTAADKLKAAFTNKNANGEDVLDWAALGTAVFGLYNQFGGDSASSPAGYNKSIPKMDMVRQQVQYNDPNRRPGEAGRQYFTDTQYVPRGDSAGLAAAKEAAATQAAGIAAAAPQAAAKVNPWAGKMNLAALKPATQQVEKTTANTGDITDPNANTSYPLIPTARGLDALPGASTSAYKPSAGGAQSTSPNTTTTTTPASTDINAYRDAQKAKLDPATQKFADTFKQEEEIYGGAGKTAPPSFVNDPEYIRLVNARNAVRGGGDMMTMDYKPEDAALDSYLRSKNPTYYQSETLPDGTVIGGKVGVVDDGFSLWNAPANPIGADKSANAVGADYKTTAADIANSQSQVDAAKAAAAQYQGNAMAHGGIAALAKGGRYLSGKTDGMADKIPTSIDGKDPAALSHGEFVIPADVVSHLGNGNSEAGAQKLYDMMARIRKARTGNAKQGKRINPDKFLPGGLAKAYMTGGVVKGFPDGGTVPTVTTNTPTTANTTGTTGGTPPDRSTSSTLSPWVGDYVTDALGQGAAMAAKPYEAYTGPLTAGESDLQQQAFAGASELAQAGFTPGTFNAAAASQYMNPYLSAALQPSLDEARRQAQISRVQDAGRLTKAGAYGGGRQAIMESELNRNLMDKQNQMLTQGYATAYDKAMGQFNTEEAARKGAADFSRATIKDLADLGAQQRAIEQEGIAADKAQFEEQRDWAYKMPQYQLDLLKNLPIKTETTSVDQTSLNKLMGDIAGLRSLYETLSGLGQTGGN